LTQTARFFTNSEERLSGKEFKKLRPSLKHFLLRELPMPVFTIVFALAYLASTRDCPFIVIRYPYAVIGTMSILLILISAGIVRRARTSGPEHRPVEVNLVYVGMIILYSVLYLVFIPLLGFFSSTVLFLLAMMVSLKVREPLVLAGVPVVYVAVSYLVFRVFLHLPLPGGWLF
jgi:hypothetical protein